MSKKPCPVCGPNYFGASGPHSEVCTPALRRLVRAAERIGKCWDTNDFSDEWDNAHHALARAVAAWRKERAK